MLYCNECLQPDTRPNTKFSETGICPACSYFKKLKSVDWTQRERTLNKLVAKYRKKSKSKFDCLIGVSGGKDSTRQALWVREKLKLNPLLVCLTYPPEQVTQRGVDNISNLIELGFDVMISAPAPGVWRELMREAFFKFTNWAKSTELALFSCVPQLAIRLGIPLILWGENPGLQLGDLKTLGATGYDGNNLRMMNTLSGGSFEWMRECGIERKFLLPYVYPTEPEFRENDINIVYLGWFLKDWSLINNAEYSCLNGLEIREDSAMNTGDLFGVTSLDEDWVTLNQMIKYYKFGFGRATDYVNEEIRLGRMTRNEGINFADKYDGVCSEEYIESFSNYIGITSSSFLKQVKGSINHELFKINNHGLQLH